MAKPKTTIVNGHLIEVLKAGRQWRCRYRDERPGSAFRSVIGLYPTIDSAMEAGRSRVRLLGEKPMATPAQAGKAAQRLRRMREEQPALTPDTPDEGE